ncbi:MAG: hypothetical protein ABIO80_02095 [Sphingomicrobium sp.]
MRVLILFAGASLALTGCGKNDQAASAPAETSDLTADRIVANDVTAIDAVTADAANMAADVDYNMGEEDAVNGLGNQSGSAQPKPSVKHRPTSAKAAIKPADASTGNSAD